MHLTLREEHWIKCCMKLIAVISYDNYVQQSIMSPFLRTGTIIDSFQCSGNFCLFKIKLISLCVSESKISPPASISSVQRFLKRFLLFMLSNRKYVCFYILHMRAIRFTLLILLKLINLVKCWNSFCFPNLLYFLAYCTPSLA
jgi:hypothetical protein